MYRTDRYGFRCFSSGESSRVARMASGGQLGFAQSIFQAGGNAGSALGPLFSAFVLSNGQSSIAWFSILALIAMILLEFAVIVLVAQARRQTGSDRWQILGRMVASLDGNCLWRKLTLNEDSA